MADLSGDSIDAECGVRPVLVVQNNKGNAYSTSYIVALITSRPKKYLPTHVVIGDKFGLRKKSTVLCEHLATVRKDMPLNFIGSIVNTKYEREVDDALKVSLHLT